MLGLHIILQQFVRDVISVLLLAFTVFAINLVTFAIMAADKAASKTGGYRIAERTLFLCAMLGGGIGGTIGMFYFHHKTKHKQFLFGFPTIAVIQALIMLQLLI